jgi:hypothetical protein
MWLVETLADVMLFRGVSEHICSDNGPEFVAKDLKNWQARVETGTSSRGVHGNRILREYHCEMNA